MTKKSKKVEKNIKKCYNGYIWMKKSILIIFTIVIIIVTIIFIRYSAYKAEYNNVLRENAEYEQYKDKEIYGIELATIINKTMDQNIKNEKDDYIEIEIYIKDNEQTYKMETFYNTGMQNFIRYYGNIEFKCSKIEYHKNTGKMKYLLFEQM